MGQKAREGRARTEKQGVGCKVTEAVATLSVSDVLGQAGAIDIAMRRDDRWVKIGVQGGS
jgi:hypothetical protein